MTLFIPELSMSFFVSHNHVTVTVIYDNTSILTLSSQNENVRKRKEKLLSLLSSTLTKLRYSVIR